MKKNMFFLAIVLIAVLVCACQGPTETEGLIGPATARIVVGSEKNYNIDVGDSIFLGGDVTILRADDSVLRLYASNPNDLYHVMTWTEGITLNEILIRVMLWKNNAISGIMLYIKTLDGYLYPLDNLQYDLEIGGYVIPLNRLYQAKTEPINGKKLYLGYYRGIKFNASTGNFESWGSHFDSQLQDVLISWDANPDSTSFGNGLVELPDSLDYLNENIDAGMTVFIQSSYSNMGKMPMVWNVSNQRFEATIKVLPSTPTSQDSLTSFQSIFIAESSPSWEQKILGINVYSSAIGTELINISDFDSGQGQWNLLTFGVKENYSPTNLEWMDNRFNFIIGEISPH